MSKITNSSFLVLLISFFVLTSCEKEDSNLSSSLNITLNPGQGLTTADLEGLKLGIVKLPDGTTEDDNLDSLAWTSEPMWIIDSANTNGTIVFENLTAGIYLAEIDNDSLQFENFSNAKNNVYIYVENSETTNQTINIVLSEAENAGCAVKEYDMFPCDEELLSVTIKCYDKNNTITKTISVEENFISLYLKVNQTESVGRGHLEFIEDVYRINWTKHCLRDEFYKIEIELINNNDGTIVTKSVLPKSESWKSYSSINESLTVGNIETELTMQYENTIGKDRFKIQAIIVEDQ